MMLSTVNRSELFRSFGPALELALMNNVHDAIAEDLGNTDWTGLLVPEGKRCTARLLCRDAAVVCGQDWFTAVFRTLCPDAHLNWTVAEGEEVAANTVVCEIEAQARPLLTAERPAMNYLQLLSAVATRTRHFVRLVEGTQAAILDTRKTLPGMRLAQKYAVRVGGGENQRLALYDGILIKENHIAAAGGIAAVLKQAHRIAPSQVSVQIEVESLAELQDALDGGAKSVLLDNFDLQMMRDAVALNAGRAILEASGGVNESTVRAIAETGVDRISIGSLTKDIHAVDFSLRVQD
ncbi:carboxylating nicotinate-nucleotide diphosphorylase [Limnobacter humi]|uniref:nicotinate-nucleotide diphosphorylase (carboxylating) n=1 Tax=Limnobacter humi TaxID=1778671 RepID=A0ABT1WC67_9BURK|nr:carboxylating nicotinate-nucleotide diphosphorylase [Limnobacter humi]MCQ8895110.1 carboxylating nicotinate-nucleotide diphosphorylase [Limnobacter humi]